MSPPIDGRHPGEPILEYIARSVGEMRRELVKIGERLERHVLDDANTHGDIDGALIGLKKDVENHGRAIADLEEAEENTGVHNLQDLRKTLERERALRAKILLAIASSALATVTGIVLKKLGLL